MKHKILLIVLISMVANIASAHDFEVDGIYYRITSSTVPLTVAASYHGNTYYYSSGEYSGSVTIPENVTYNDNIYSVTSIDEGSFFDCSGLISVNIPNSVTSIGGQAFCWCNSLTSITLPKNITEIGYFAFGGCSSLSSITIPENVTSIGKQAFTCCTGLVSVVIPESVTIIDSEAFSGCSSLTSINIPENVSYIGYAAFADCSSLTTIIIPNNLTNISELVFNNCSGLTSIIISNSVTSIGYRAFENCSSLTSISIPNSVISIEEGAFSNCSGLTSITIPNSVTSIGYAPFQGCSGLESIFVENGNTMYDSREGCNAIINTVSNTLIAGCKNSTIPNSVTSIGDHAFDGCCDITSITIPNSVTSIGTFAFYNCSSLASITIPSSVVSIDIYAFEGCKWYEDQPDGLIYAGKVAYKYKGIMPEGTDIVLKEGTMGITSSAFYGCSGLTSITIPNSVTSIGGSAFHETAWYNNQPDGLIYAGKVAYNYKGTMPEGTDVVLKDGTMGIAGHAFRSCKGLASITIPEGVTTICAYAFIECSGLTSITIPSSVTTIGVGAFGGCGGLTIVQVENPCPLSIDAYTFSNRTNATLYVPAGCKEAYEMANVWNEFKEIVEMEDSRTEQTMGLATIPAFTYGDATYTLPATTVEGLTLTWSADNNAVVSISGNMLTVVGAGTATVTATQTGNDNYKPFSREFALTVNKARLTITADDKTKEEGEDNPELTVTYSGFENGDNASSLTTQPTVTTTATKDSPVGTYPITVSGAASSNYEFTYVNGTLTVTEKPVILVPTDISQMDNAIYIESFAARVGGDVNIEICLKNAEAATAYVFELVLPEGITVAKNDKGKYIDALSDRHDDHTRTFNDKGNNTYSLSTLSGNSEELTGNDGAIRLLTLSVADDLAEGVYAIQIKNASYSKPDGTLVTLPNTISSVTVEDYVLGDVNGNDGVDIGDAVSIVNYLVGKESSNFVEKAADTNKNGQIDIGDAVTIVNFLVGKTESLSRQTNKEWSEKEPQ